MKTITVLSWLGLALGIPLVIIICGCAFNTDGCAYGFGYTVGYLGAILLCGAINLKAAHFFLMRKKEEEFKKLAERIEKLEGEK